MTAYGTAKYAIVISHDWQATRWRYLDTHSVTKIIHNIDGKFTNKLFGRNNTCCLFVS